MSQRASVGMGERIQRYRRIAGISARELAESAGMGLTRGVIANLESNRKTDITVDQLLAIADVLKVPPVVLALPADQPHRFVRLTDGTNSHHAVRAETAVEWFHGSFRRASTADETNAATTVSFAMLRNLADYRSTLNHLHRCEEMLREAEAGSDDHTKWSALLQEDQERIDGLLPILEELGVDTTTYSIYD